MVGANIPHNRRQEYENDRTKFLIKNNKYDVSNIDLHIILHNSYLSYCVGTFGNHNLPNIDGTGE